MKLSGFHKYFLFLLLSFEVVVGRSALGSTSGLPSLHNSTTTALKSNHKNQLTVLVVCDFVEENENEEDLDAHFSFGFISPLSDSFIFIGTEKTVLSILNYSPFSVVKKQKINVLNCSFLI
ncbi:MAG: hypothetical protein V4585_01385 [Bacteroidota bacterium]|jgi:hypothetical protein